MGMPLIGGGRCPTSYGPSAPPPNPDPLRWWIVRTYIAPRGFVLEARYLDCTNFEGVKIMVYEGGPARVLRAKKLDPHFSTDRNSPVARFRPDAAGWERACRLADSL